MDVSEWQERLEREFTHDGVVGGQFAFVFPAERAHAAYVSAHFKGQEVLIDSFQGFFVETIRRAVEFSQQHGWGEGERPYYAPTLVQFVLLFRKFRACQTLLQRGYPMEGYALLRDLKDQACFIAGIAHNYTTHAAVWGIGVEAGEDEADRRRSRMSAQGEVLARLLRQKSGLDDATREQLTLWEQLFHAELHGSQLSRATALVDWTTKGLFPPLEPQPRELELAMYMNRAAEVAWMLTRLLPFLQPEAGAFGEEWDRRRLVLDDSFRFMQQNMSEIGKEIGAAFIRFMDEKLCFDEPFHYEEADGTA